MRTPLTRTPASLLTLTLALLLPACSDYTSIEIESSGPELSLGVTTTEQRVRLQVCYEGSNADELDAEIAATVSAGDSSREVTLEMEDGRFYDTFSGAETGRLFLSMESLGGSPEAACEGVVLIFLVEETSADAVTIEWEAKASATQIYGDEILGDSISIDFELL